MKLSYEPLQGAQIGLCDGVYEPAEDTWLAVEVLGELFAWRRPRLCVDIGTGTGVLASYCLSRGAGWVVGTDVSPCAVLCAAAAEPLSSLGGVVQCDVASCLRCPLPQGTVVVYNTPYLPVQDEGLEALAWSGGIRPALEAAEWAVECLEEGCIVLVYSSLSGPDDGLLELLRGSGFFVAQRRRHYFFEDIVVTWGCRGSAWFSWGPRAR